MGRHSNDWQDTDSVLRLFGEKVSAGRSRYRAFVEKGIIIGKREDLIGGGLIRSHGGWANVKAMRRARIFEKECRNYLWMLLGDHSPAQICGKRIFKNQ